MTGYLSACTSSILVSLGLRTALSGATKNMIGSKLYFANSISSFFACAAAGFLNAYIMRKSELEKGIDLMNPKNPGVSLGKSKVAASEAVTNTAYSRIFLALPLLIPAVILYGIERAKMMPKGPVALTLLQGGIFVGELYFAVPFACAAFPQYASISADKVEAEFRDLKDQEGHRIKDLMYNKGL